MANNTQWSLPARVALVGGLNIVLIGMAITSPWLLLIPLSLFVAALFVDVVGGANRETDTERGW